MRALIAALLLTTTLFAPHVSAAAPCAPEAGATAIGPLYLAADLTIWQESNNLGGLQRATCEDDNGRGHVGDTQIA